MDPRDLRDLVEREIKRLIEPTAWARCEVVNRAEQQSLKTHSGKMGRRMMAAAAKPAASTGKQQRFAPAPLRALRDQRLGGLHLRTLGIIAAFDRLGKNGGGCWASKTRWPGSRASIKPG